MVHFKTCVSSPISHRRVLVVGPRSGEPSCSVFQRGSVFSDSRRSTTDHLFLRIFIHICGVAEQKSPFSNPPKESVTKIAQRPLPRAQTARRSYRPARLTRIGHKSSFEWRSRRRSRPRRSSSAFADGTALQNGARNSATPGKCTGSIYIAVSYVN